MSKRKQTPLQPGLASSQDQRRQQASLTAEFTFVDQQRGDVWLSVERAAQFGARLKDAAAAGLRMRREARARTIEAIEGAATRRRMLAEELESDRALKRFWRRFKAKVRKPAEREVARRRDTSAPVKGGSRKPGGHIRLARYGGPIIDSVGRRGVYMDVRYYGARRARVGVARRLVVYIARDEALERDGTGKPIILSNVGANPDEQAMAFDLVEVLNRAAQSDAKIVFSMILTLPHDISADARKAILARFCEEAFALHDLPYVATAHMPPEEGDQRNHHCHVVFALRPFQHVGDYEWEVGRELRTEFDSKERFTFYRKLFAGIMTEVVRQEGKHRTYTHLSNAARGLRNKPLLPLGPVKTAAVRRGDYVPDEARNREEIARGEKLLREDRSGRRLARQQARIDELRALHADMVDLPSVGEMPVPEPVLGFAMTAVGRWVEPVHGDMREPLMAAEAIVQALPIALGEVEAQVTMPPIEGMSLEPVVTAAALSLVTPPVVEIPIDVIRLANSQEMPVIVSREPLAALSEHSIAMRPVSALTAPALSVTMEPWAVPGVGARLTISRAGQRGREPLVLEQIVPVAPVERPVISAVVPAVAREPLVDGVNQMMQMPPALVIREEQAIMMDVPQRPVERTLAKSQRRAESIKRDDIVDLLRLHIEAGNRAAERQQARIRKRRGTGIPPWGMGGPGLGG